MKRFDLQQSDADFHTGLGVEDSIGKVPQNLSRNPVECARAEEIE